MRGRFGICLLIFALIAAVASDPVHAQNTAPKGKPAGSKGGGAVAATAASDAPTALKAAADALGMLRGPNRIDAINTMEFWGSGTSYSGGQAYKTDYHVALGYDPPGMRVEIKRTGAKGGAAERILQVVNDKYSWNETEIGSGLAGGKGSATPAAGAFESRSLQLWTLPYGAIKAGMAAGEKAKLSVENGATVITFPLSGQLAGITLKVTLGAKSLVTKVEAQSDKPTPDMITQTDYSTYADRGDITSDLQFPGHIIQKQGDKIVLDVMIKMDDPNNPFLIFPAPDSVMSAGK
jgi:hypothetical protein